MRGTPPLHLVIFGVVFAALAVPLAQLTFSRPPVASMAAAVESAKTRTYIRFRYAHVPLSVSVKLDGRELVSSSELVPPNAGPVEFQSELSIPKEGIEFVVNVRWPEGTPDTAFAIELEPDGLDAQSQTRWSDGAKLEDVFNFQWKQES